MEKFTFHIPSYYAHDGSIYACDSSDFKRELVGACVEAGADYYFIVPARRFLRGSEFPFEMLVVFETNDSECLYTDIFIELVCKYHSELRQRCYYYEHGDNLVHLELGGKDDEGC